MRRSPRGRGQLDRYIKFQVAVVAADERNQEIRNWVAMTGVDGLNSTDGGCFCKTNTVAPSLLRDERFEGRQWVAKTWTDFIVPYSRALMQRLSARETCRIVDDLGAVFDLMYVAEIDEPGVRRRWIEILGYTRSDHGVMTQ